MLMFSKTTLRVKRRLKVSKRIAVIGAGNGGFAMAGDLTLAGFEVNLFELPRFENNLVTIREKGGLEITGVARTGFAKLAHISTNIEEAIEGCVPIMVVTQALAHEEVAELLAPIIKPGQCVFLLPGSAGALLFGKIFHERQASSKIGIAEGLTLPYACRKTGPESVNVSRFTGRPGLGSFPGKDIDWIFPIFQEIYPSSFKMDSALEVGICNANIILHPAPTLLSISRIEFSKGDFYIYNEAYTPSVEKVIEALDREIAAILKCLGFSSTSSKESFEKRYESTWTEKREEFRKIGSKGPFDAKSRYITEDVPIGMVLISSLGKLLSIPTPTFDSIIHLSGVFNDTNYWKTGRTLEKLGLEGMSVEALRNFLKKGYT
jgi:opine dehydrogenase